MNGTSMRAEPIGAATVRPVARRGGGVRVAIVDSGVHARHPHVGGIAGGIGIEGTGRICDDCVDRLGHGTAVAGAIREKAPDAELYAVRIFETSLTTNVRVLVAAIHWAIEAQMHVVNLSLGTAKAIHQEVLADAVSAAVAAGVILVAAHDDGGTRWWPGSLCGVLPVRADASVPRETFQVDREGDTVIFRASPFARPIPGVALERNLNGISFAVANMTGLVAAAIDPRRRRYTVMDAVTALAASHR